MSRNHQQRVFSLVYHLVRRRDEVEDLVQEVFIKAFRAIRSYNFQSSFATWLSRIATNHCYDYLRHERASRVSFYWQMGEDKQRELENSVESQPADELDHEERTVLHDLVDKLLSRAPENDRTILILKELQDYSVEEIARDPEVEADHREGSTASCQEADARGSAAVAGGKIDHALC